MLCAWEKDDCASKGKNLVWLSPRHAVDACNRYQELGSISIAKGFILCSKLVRRRGQMLRNRQFEMRQPSRECSPVKFRECALINKEQLSLSSAMAKEKTCANRTCDLLAKKVRQLDYRRCPRLVSVHCMLSILVECRGLPT
jgi:hypothetical protein